MTTAVQNYIKSLNFGHRVQLRDKLVCFLHGVQKQTHPPYISY